MIGTEKMTWDEFWEEAKKCADAQRPTAASCSKAEIQTYINGKRAVIANNLAAEKLAGNEAKQKCERAALAELDALEQFICARL